jgi:hypothetical protein
MMEKKELTFERLHSFDTDTLLRGIMGIALEMQEEYGMDYEWRDSTTLGFWSRKGMTRGLEGTLQFSSTHVRMVLQLPFGLRPMAGKIAEEVNDYLNRNVGTYGSQS